MQTDPEAIPGSAGNGRERLGILLRRHRERRGLTQEDLAGLTEPGVSVDTISAVERGRSRPYRHTLDALADALELDARQRVALHAARQGLATDDRSESTPAAPPMPSQIGPIPLVLPPAPLTPLVGREHEEAAVAHLLHRGDVRLLTLLGVGGVGKTRLAQQVARSVSDAFSDGVAWVNLAPLHDPALVLSTIVTALGLRDAGGQPATAQLAAYLRDRRLLLVLDNFEQVVEAAPALTTLTGDCAGAVALVTSRTALQVRGEHRFPVPPLRVPEPERTADYDALAGVPAVALFVERARAVSPAFSLTAANAKDVATICARLDGLPLALELAAARIVLFPPSLLVERLERGLDLLAGGARDLPQRQRTLRATMKWSDELLTPSERRLFYRISVFSGGCTLEAVLEMWDALASTAHTDEDRLESLAAEEDVLSGVAALIAHSLIRRQGLDGQDEPRIVLLETIRAYAMERLEASGEGEAVRRTHAAYYLALTEEAEGALQGQAQQAWLARLEEEHDNLRAALVWGPRGTGDVTVGLRLAGALALFWDAHGHLGEGRRWLEEALAAGAGHPVPVAARARALGGLGLLAYRQDDYARAGEALEEGLALARELGDTRLVTRILSSLGMTLAQQGEHARARPLLEESLATGRLLGDASLTATLLINLGDVARARGEGATSRYAEALRLCREMGSARLMAYSLEGLAAVRVTA